MHGLLLIVLPLLTSLTTGCLYPRSTDSTGPEWTYIGPTGPLLWHTLSSNFSLCSAGRTQSPIDLTAHSTELLYPGSVSQFYPATADFSCTNNGKTIICIPGNKNRFVLQADRNNEWRLENFHWHTPGEHLLDGKLAVAELHWVHSRKNGTENAVVGVRFRLQEESGDEKKRKNWTPRGRVQREEQMFVVTFAEEVVSKVQRVGSTVEVKGLPLSDVIAHTKGSEVLHYMGSLTTPPCSEGIKWYVAKKEMALEVEEFNMLVDVMKYNARYVQDTPGEKNLLEKVVEHGVGGSTGI